MSTTTILTIPGEMQLFLTQSDAEYRRLLATIDLFNQTKTATWDRHQKQYFAAVFYHIRGYFIDFMWYIANFSTDKEVKKIIMQNIWEELGLENKLSHESLYKRFASECGVNIDHEIIHETHYLPFARLFNKGHLRWLTEHDSEEQFAAFSAYERLDNIDYLNLCELVKSLHLSQQAMTFFNVHVHVQHFESSVQKLIPTWEKSPQKVKDAVNFIYSHQANMWQQLSNAVFT